LGYAIQGPIGLLLAHLAGESAGSASLFAAAWKKDRAPLSAVSLQGMRKTAGRYKHFPIFFGTANLIDVLGSNAPQLFFAAFYSAEVAGWFALAQMVIAAPLTIVVNSVDQVYLGEAARLHRDDPKSMRRFFLKLTGQIALIVTIPVAVICILAPWFFPIIFGPDWEIAGRYGQILGLMFAFRLVTVPLSNTLTILERQDLFLPWDCVKLVMVVGALLAGKALGFSPIVTIAAYSVSMSTAYVLLWIIIWQVLTRACKRQG
jgi:O-antigen/teichoic acid export membrane protein